jgi:hypothetical protein
VLLNRLFVDDGDILTSAGVTTGIAYHGRRGAEVAPDEVEEATSSRAVDSDGLLGHQTHAVFSDGHLIHPGT